RHETIADIEFAALLEPDLAVLLHKHTVTCCDTYRSPVCSLRLIQNFVDGVADHALNRAEFHLVIIQSKAKDVSQWFSNSFGNAVFVGAGPNQSRINEASHGGHSYAAAISYKAMFVAVHAHYDDAMIPQ